MHQKSKAAPTVFFKKIKNVLHINFLADVELFLTSTSQSFRLKWPNLEKKKYLFTSDA